MPPIREPAYGEMTFVHHIGTMDPRSYGDQSSSLAHLHQSASVAPERSTVLPTSKRRRAPNAFILFRSHFIATGQVPPDMTHQNDVSRHVAEVWKSKLTPSDRAVFFKKAQEEKARFDIEGPRVPAKKRRSRAKKTCQSSSPESTVPTCIPQSPTSAADASFEMPSASTSTSSAVCPVPQSTPSPNIYPSPISGDASVSFSAPQAMYAVPPSLFNWDSLVDNYTPTMEDQDSPTDFDMMPLPTSSVSSYGIDCSVPLMDLDFNALQLGFNLSPAGLDMSFFGPVVPDFLLPLPFATPF